MDRKKDLFYLDSLGFHVKQSNCQSIWIFITELYNCDKVVISLLLAVFGFILQLLTKKEFYLFHALPGKNVISVNFGRITTNRELAEVMKGTTRRRRLPWLLCRINPHYNLVKNIILFFWPIRDSQLHIGKEDLTIFCRYKLVFEIIQITTLPNVVPPTDAAAGWLKDFESRSKYKY